MIEVNKEFETPEELAIWCIKIASRYCGMVNVGSCEQFNCPFYVHDGEKKSCLLTWQRVPSQWEIHMRECGVIKDE